MSQMRDNSTLYNRILLGIVLVIVLLLPVYGVVLGTALFVYGVDYLTYFLFNPNLLFDTYMVLMNHWIENAQALEASYTVKIIGPPIGAVVFVGGLLFMLRAPLLDFRPFKAEESLHGDAHWATKAEIKDAGLFSKQGVLLGSYKKGKYYIAGGFQHILLFAPTGSGKGVGFAIPNLLFWDESTCVHDIKLENYELCSGWRAKQGQDVYVWNPADVNGITHCYNPMDWISSKPGQMVDDVQKISNLILPEQEFWNNEARSLLVGVILYLCAVPEKTTSFGEVVRTMRSDDVTYNLAVVLDTIGKKIHPVAYMNIAAFLQKADKERSGVVSTMNSGLELWANPLIDTATASSDFNINEWKKKKITVYCGVTPDNLQRLQPLLQVFYQQASDILTRHMPRDDEPFGVLFLLDEFPTLGKMPQFESGIAYFRGYRCRLFLIVQDTQQLKGIYEEAGMNSFLSNSTYRVTFAANNVETANLISQLIGNKTVKTESHNQPRFLDLNPAARTMHVSETQRALLLPQEVIGLPRDEQIILIESQPPIKCKKIFYYKDSFFTKRLLEQTPVPEQEPYDPRKGEGRKKADKPDSKPGDAAAGGGAKPPEKPDAGAAAKKGTPALPPSSGATAGKPDAASGDAARKKPNPFDLPPLPGKAGEKPGGAGATAGGDAKKKPNPFDLPPLPKKPGDKPDASGASDAGGAKKKPNPFDLPPLPKKAGDKPATATATAGAAPNKKTSNPFDLPPLPKKATDNPATGAKTTGESAKPKPTSPFGAPLPKKPATTTANSGVKKKAANPFDLPPIPTKTTTAAIAKPKANDEENNADNSAEGDADTAAPTPKPTMAKKTANPFDLPPIPAKKTTPAAQSDTKEIPPKLTPQKRPAPKTPAQKASSTANPFGAPLPKKPVPTKPITKPTASMAKDKTETQTKAAPAETKAKTASQSVATKKPVTPKTSARKARRASRKSAATPAKTNEKPVAAKATTEQPQPTNTPIAKQEPPMTPKAPSEAATPKAPQEEKPAPEKKAVSPFGATPLPTKKPAKSKGANPFGSGTLPTATKKTAATPKPAPVMPEPPVAQKDEMLETKPQETSAVAETHTTPPANGSDGSNGNTAPAAEPVIEYGHAKPEKFGPPIPMPKSPPASATNSAQTSNDSAEAAKDVATPTPPAPEPEHHEPETMQEAAKIDEELTEPLAEGGLAPEDAAPLKEQATAKIDDSEDVDEEDDDDDDLPSFGAPPTVPKRKTDQDSSGA